MKDNIHIAAMKRGAPYLLGVFIFVGLFVKFPAAMFFLFIAVMMIALCYFVGRLVMAITEEDRKYEE